MAIQFVTCPNLAGGFKVKKEFLLRFKNAWETHEAKKRAGFVPHWETFYQTAMNFSFCTYISRGELNRECDIMMANRPEFGIRPLMGDNPICVTEIK